MKKNKGLGLTVGVNVGANVGGTAEADVAEAIWKVAGVAVNVGPRVGVGGVIASCLDVGVASTTVIVIGRRVGV